MCQQRIIPVRGSLKMTAIPPFGLRWSLRAPEVIFGSEVAIVHKQGKLHYILLLGPN